MFALLQCIIVCTLVGFSSCISILSAYFENIVILWSRLSKSIIIISVVMCTSISCRSQHISNPDPQFYAIYICQPFGAMWPTNVPLQLIHYQSSGPKAKTEMRVRERETSLSVHTASSKGKHERNTFLDKIFSLSELTFTYVSWVLWEKTVVVTVIHGRGVSNRI